MKKLIIATVVALIFNIFSISFASANMFYDVEDKNMIEAVRVLNALGVINGYDDGSFHPSDYVSREEMAKLTATMLDLPVYTGEADSTFSDVSNTRWSFPYVKLLEELDIINGYEDGSFKPEKTITGNEAVKIIVSFYGYSKVAESRGGFPEGYNKLAMSLGLTQNTVNFDFQGPVTRGNIAIMLYNLLELSYIDENYNEISATDRSYIEEVFNTYVDDGTVTAVDNSSIGRENAEKGYIFIDDERYLLASDAHNIVPGMMVDFYCRINPDTDEKAVIYIREKKVKNYIINGKDIYSVSGLYTSKASIVYHDGKKVRKISPKANANILYNDSHISEAEVGRIDFLNINGYIECVDYANGISLIKIYHGEDYVVKHISITDEKVYITDELNKILQYKTDEETDVKITKNGVAVSIDDICQGDVISVNVSIDNKVYKLDATDKKIVGAVSMVDNSEALPKVTIGEAEYGVSQSFVDAGLEIELNRQGTFYLNSVGNVVYVDTEKIKNYAYFTSLGTTDGLRSNVEVKLLMPYNKFEIFRLSDKIKFTDYDGETKVITPREFVERFDRTDEYVIYDKRLAESRCIVYELDSEGRIDVFTCAYGDIDEGLPMTSPAPSGSDFVLSAPESKSFYYSNYLFNQKYKVTAKTVVFKIPCSNYDGELIERFSSGSPGDYFANGNTYQVKLYDVDSTGEVGLILYSVVGQTKELEYSVSGSSSPSMIIEKVRYTNDYDGVARPEVIGLVNGEYKSYFLADEIIKNKTLMSKIKFGNVILFELNSQEVNFAEYEGDLKIAAAMVILDRDNEKYRQKWDNSKVYSPSAGLTTSLGFVSDIDSTMRIVLNLPGNEPALGNEMPYYFVPSDVIVRINNETNKLEIVPFENIAIGEKLFVRQRYNVIRDTVVY